MTIAASPLLERTPVPRARTLAGVMTCLLRAMLSMRGRNRSLSACADMPASFERRRPLRGHPSVPAVGSMPSQLNQLALDQRLNVRAVQPTTFGAIVDQQNGNCMTAQHSCLHYGLLMCDVTTVGNNVSGSFWPHTPHQMSALIGSALRRRSVTIYAPFFKPTKKYVSANRELRNTRPCTPIGRKCAPARRDQMHMTRL